MRSRLVPHPDIAHPNKAHQQHRDVLNRSKGLNLQHFRQEHRRKEKIFVFLGFLLLIFVFYFTYYKSSSLAEFNRSLPQAKSNVVNNSTNNTNVDFHGSSPLVSIHRDYLLVKLDGHERYSERPLDHLTFEMRTGHVSPFVSDFTVRYFRGSVNALRKSDGLYNFDNYLNRFEGSVTHTWLSILAKFNATTVDDRKYIVVDGGMNTGFYTLLTARLGYQVHSFDVQKDCFDVAQLLLQQNGMNAHDYNFTSKFYFMGLWSNNDKSFVVKEGCDPGRGIDNYDEGAEIEVSWDRRSHNVSVVTLDSFLDSLGDPTARVALLKLDIEGAETAALMGLDRNAHRVENIILEYAPSRLKRMGFDHDKVRSVFTRLITESDNGSFTPYLLYQPRIPFEKWFNDTFLAENVGCVSVKTHPILGINIEDIDKKMTNVILWKIQDMDRFLSQQLFKAGNLLFARI